MNRGYMVYFPVRLNYKGQFKLLYDVFMRFVVYDKWRGSTIPKTSLGHSTADL